MSQKNDSILKLGIILCTITLLVALSLAVVNELTKDVVAKTRENNTKVALQQVINSADDFKKLESNEVANGVMVYEALKSGEVIGYCINTFPVGYGGPINMIVGVDMQLKVTGVSVTDMKETPGLGTLAKEDSFKNQFIGKTGTIKVNKDGGDIVALSGATITSRAVTKGVNEALEIAKQISGEGNVNE